MWVIKNLLNLIFIINYISCNWLGVSRLIQIDVQQIIALRRRYAGIDIANAQRNTETEMHPSARIEEEGNIEDTHQSRLNCAGTAASPKARIKSQQSSKTATFKQQAVFLSCRLKLNVNHKDIRRTDSGRDRGDKTRWAKGQDNIWILRNFSISW